MRLRVDNAKKRVTLVKSFRHPRGLLVPFEGNAQATTVQPEAMGKNEDGTPKPQVIARGPVAAVVAIKQLGTNGGGFFGPNPAHPFENPTSWTNLVECVSIILIPMAVLVMFGRMIRDARHATVIFTVLRTIRAKRRRVGVCTEIIRTAPEP